MLFYQCQKLRIHIRAIYSIIYSIICSIIYILYDSPVNISNMLSNHYVLNNSTVFTLSTINQSLNIGFFCLFYHLFRHSHCKDAILLLTNRNFLPLQLRLVKIIFLTYFMIFTTTIKAQCA